jgi:phosphoglycerate dehydrogenase-like enzyme
VSVVTVPPSLLELLGPVEGVEVLPWDLRTDPPRAGEVEVVVVPTHQAPWVTRLAELPRLRAVQLGSAGHEHALRFLPPGVTLSNAVGVHDTATAELALALLLAAQRDLPDFVRAQASGEWAAPQQRRSVADSTVVVVGYGGIGRALATRLRACEAEVVAVASRARAGDGLVDQVHGVAELPALLPRAGVLTLATPLTEGTRRLVDAAALALLPDDALVVNVGRGAVVDTDALVAECARGRLRAALDVTDPEPLPPDHPLWSTRGVLVSPHTAGSTSAFTPRMARYLRAQLTAYGQTGQLPHVVATG